MMDSVVSGVKEGAKMVAEHVIPNLTTGFVGGSVGVAMAKATTGMPPAQRALLVAGTAGATAASVTIGNKLGADISKNIDITSSIKNSRHGNPDIDRVPSPDQNMINCPIEKGDDSIPLVDILEGIFELNILEIVYIIILILIVFNRFFYKINVDFILKLVNKYLPEKYTAWLNKYTNTSVEINNKFTSIMFIVVSILLILVKLCNIYFTGHLYNNIDDYVLVYNHLKKNSDVSCLIILLLNNKVFSQRYNVFPYTTSTSPTLLRWGVGITNTNYRFMSTATENTNIKYEDNINLDIQTKIEKFGSYENYLTQLENDNAVTNEFILKYYPNLVEDELFYSYLNELNPSIRREVKYILDLYEYIIKFNSIKDKIFIYNKYLPNELKSELITEFNFIRKNIIQTLKDLGYNKTDDFINKNLVNIKKNMKNKIIFDESVFNYYDIIKYEDDYINIFELINKFLKKDLINESTQELSYTSLNLEDKKKEIENLLLKIFSLYKYIEENKIYTTYSKKQWFEKYINEIIYFSKLDKTEKYRIKKGDYRVKRMGPSKIISGYKDILNQMIDELKLLIINQINNTIHDKESLLNNKINVMKKIELLDKTIKKDFNVIFDNVSKAFDIYQFISNISQNLTDKNIKEQYTKFIEFFEDIIKKNNTTHDELINIYELLNKYNKNYIRINENELSRENSLSSNSYLYISCREIINNDKISVDKKQLMLENFILNYEKEFTLNIIKNMNSSLSDYKLLTRIYKHSTPLFRDRIYTFIENNKKRNYELYLKNKNNISKLSEHIALVLFMTMNTDQLINIIFSKVVRFIGLSGGITQNELLINLSDEMLILLKYNIKNNKVLEKLSKEDQNIVEEIKDKLENLAYEIKYKFGDLLLELILDEFNYIFTKNSIYENNEHYIYISIKQGYLAILTSSIFNPIKLPMISPPKKWEFEKLDQGIIEIKEIGGYYLDQFNEISKNNQIIRQHVYNKYNSLISENQINSINFLNNRAFKINKEILELVIKEWNCNDSNLFNGLNRLHPLTNEFENVRSSIKKDILSHNSKYWINTNIINIALLMKDQTIYFTTFLDFRGRIYPTSHYLNYQSSDLARSLLLFNDIPKTKKDANIYDNILQDILNDSVYKGKTKNKDKNIILNNIDYFKIYLANMYGKDKLTRKGRIKWVDNNINDIMKTYQTDYNLFKQKYLLVSKEPFQFLTCILSFYNYKNKKIDIKVPILFDASCSGIQHLSALTTDIKIAKLVNLLNNIEPLDFYKYCLEQIIVIIKELPTDDNQDTNKIFKDKILKLKIDRKWLKHTIMTIPYNVTNIGISDKLIIYFDRLYIDIETKNKLDLGKINLTQILEQNIKQTKFDLPPASSKALAQNVGGIYIFIPKIEILLDKNSNNLYFTYKELFLLSNIIKNTVLNIIPPFNQLKLYFDKIIEIMKKLNLSIL